MKKWIVIGVILLALVFVAGNAFYTVEENQNHWYPTKNGTMQQIIHERYQELFYPTEKEWREKTVADFTQACKGVLNAKLK